MWSTIQVVPSKTQWLSWLEHLVYNQEVLGLIPSLVMSFNSHDVASSSQQMARDAIQVLMDALQGPEAPTAAPSCCWPNSTLYFNLLQYS